MACQYGPVIGNFLGKVRRLLSYYTIFVFAFPIFVLESAKRSIQGIKTSKFWADFKCEEKFRKEKLCRVLYGWYFQSKMFNILTPCHIWLCVLQSLKDFGIAKSVLDLDVRG